MLQRTIMIFNFLVVVCVIASLCNVSAVRVTCIGDSITEGGACGSSGYVPVLAGLLGSDYNVTNAGASGMTQLKHGQCGDYPSTCSYWYTDAWQRALSSEPDIVTIMLGTNDAKFYNWEGIQQNTGDYYTLDYVDMIQRVRNLPSKPEVFVMIPPPLFKDKVFDMNQTIINTVFPTLVRDLASVMSTNVIDIYSAVLGEATDSTGSDLSCDGCHPTAKGNQIIADTMYPYIVNAAKKRIMV